MRTFLAVVPLLASALVAPLPAQAAADTCQGQPATIVGTPAQPVLDGTDGPDVIVSGGAGTVNALGGNDLVCVTGETLHVDAGLGDDLVDARQRPGNGSTVLGDGADTYLGGPGYDEVDSGGIAGTGFYEDDHRDVIRIGAGGGAVRSGVAWNVNDDVLVLGTSGTGVNANAVSFWGRQGADGRLKFGDGEARLHVGDTPYGGLHWVVDNRTRLISSGSPWLSWTGNVSDFDVEMGEVPGGEDILMTFLGTSRAETVHVSGEADRLDLRLGGGGDVVDLPECFSFRQSLVDLGSGVDTVQVGCDALAVRLDRGKVQPGVEARGLEVLDVSGTGVEVWGDVAPNRITVFGCRAIVHGGPGGDVIKANVSCPGTLTRLHGGRGDDRLIGSRGRDVLVGDRGRDFANGREGPDLCRAEATRNCEDI